MSVPPPDRDPELIWTPEGEPRSGRFGDVYFSAEDGLAETRAVFLDGCGLPEAWRGRARFTVGELGFGTGLNIAALLELWRSTRAPGARMNIFSVEGFPMRREEAARALGRWPELTEVARLLLERWPPRTPGFHRVDLPEFGAVLDLAVMEAGQALAAWTGRADAWFLDGFSPASNPEMWRDEVLAGVAARSAPGARAATFTVAGFVRRGLEANGFAWAKRPGFGRKRERLEAVFPGAPEAARGGFRVAVVGGGIAGAALARALRAEGLEPVLVERAASGAGASGNAAALVTPRFDAGGGPTAELYAQAFERAGVLYRREAPAAILAEGVVQLEHQERDRARFDRIVEQPLWAEGALERLSAEAAGGLLGERAARGGLRLAEGLAVEPSAVLAAWLEGVPQVAGEVAEIAPGPDGGFSLRDDTGAEIVAADAVCLAGGWGLERLAAGLGLSPVRGQASCAAGARAPTPAAWGGYLVPTREGVLFGATHDRGQTATDARAGDDRRNLESLARVLPGLAAGLDPDALTGRAAVRAVTPDRLPLAGAIAPGLYVLGGLGSRGFTTAPLLAEHVAAELAVAPSPLSAALQRLVDATRFRAT